MINAPHTGTVVQVSSIWWSDLAGFGRVHAPGTPVPLHQPPSLTQPAAPRSSPPPVRCPRRPSLRPAGSRSRVRRRRFAVYPGPPTTPAPTTVPPPTTSTSVLADDHDAHRPRRVHLDHARHPGRPSTTTTHDQHHHHRRGRATSRRSLRRPVFTLVVVASADRRTRDRVVSQRRHLPGAARAVHRLASVGLPGLRNRRWRRGTTFRWCRGCSSAAGAVSARPPSPCATRSSKP